jgi:hypothetical protein
MKPGSSCFANASASAAWAGWLTRGEEAIVLNYDSRRLAPRFRQPCAQTLPGVREGNRQKRADVSALREVVYHGRRNLFCCAAGVAPRRVFYVAELRPEIRKSRESEKRKTGGSGGPAAGDGADDGAGADGVAFAADLAALEGPAEDLVDCPGRPRSSRAFWSRDRECGRSGRRPCGRSRGRDREISGEVRGSCSVRVSDYAALIRSLSSRQSPATASSRTPLKTACAKQPSAPGWV